MIFVDPLRGTSYGKAAISVDPVDRTIGTYVATATQGKPPQFQWYTVMVGKPPILGPWGVGPLLGNFGASGTQGYMSTIFYVDPGTTSLSIGDPVQLTLRSTLHGTFGPSVDPAPDDPYGNVYMETNIYDVSAYSNPNEWLPWFPQDNWYNRDLPLLDPLVSQGGYFPQELGSDETVISYDSDEEAFWTTVGAWLFLETFQDTKVAISAALPESVFRSGVADFENTMNVAIGPGPGFEGILLQARDFLNGPVAPVPEPSPLIILAIALLVLAYCQHGKKEGIL